MFGLDVIAKLEQANEELTEQLGGVHGQLVLMNKNIETLIKLQKERITVTKANNAMLENMEQQAYLDRQKI